MLKRICTFWLFLLFAFDANAFFGDLLACLSNPCNCFGGDRIENWDGEDLNKGDENKLCPPWNKDSGRNDNICLVQFSYPPVFTAYWQRICAEETPASTYFEPQIRVRMQECNSFACWTVSKTLNWNGECVTWPGPYGIPLVRMCARVALPYDPVRDWPEDPGYTKDEHLNFEGARKPDDPIYDWEGNEIDVDAPKLCAYLDPAFIGAGSGGDGPDLLDLSSDKQTFHKTDELHPIIRVMIFFLDMYEAVATSPLQLFEALFGMVAGASNQDENTFSQVIGGIFEAISWLIEGFFDLIKSLLKAIGQINRVVSDTNYGCVNIPLAPYPPPFCETVSSMYQPAVIQRICASDSLGVPVESREPDLCAVSKIRNNFIHNAVRVSYEDFVPLCDPDEDPLTTDTCVNIRNISSFSTPAAMHIATSLRDVIPHCDDASDASQPCVESMIEHKCDVGSPFFGCEDGFRVVYGVKMGGVLRPEQYYRHDINDCATSTSAACQDIWGINRGQFIDVPVHLPSTPTDPSVPIVNSFSLTDSEDRSTNYVARIVSQPTFDPVTQFNQTPNELCVFGDTNVEGCVDRVAFSKPLVFSCDSGYAGITCSTDYFQPEIIISAQSGSDSISDVLTPDNVTTTGNAIANIAGYDFTSFVTDDDNNKSPFSGPRSINPSTIHGEYKDGAVPYDDTGTEYPDAVYLTGVEYILGEYFRGGTKVCVEEIETDRCPVDPTKCVLTNLRNRDVVDCSIFYQKAQQYLGFNMCRDTYTDCTNIDNIPGLSGGSGATIDSCTSANGPVTCYRYSGTEPLCVAGTRASERQDPDPGLGDILSDSQYYDINSSPGYAYDKSLYALRDKTAYERNLCVDIPQPTCSATVENNTDWPAANVGEVSTGTCLPGYVPKAAPLERYCTINTNIGAEFDSIPADVGCELPAGP